MADSFYPGLAPGRLAHHAQDDGAAEAAPEQVVPQPRGGPLGGGPPERGQPSGRERARPVERRRLAARGLEGGVDQRPRHAPRGEVGAQAVRPVAARAARDDPVAGEGGVVEVAAGGEVVDDRRGDAGGGAEAAQARGEVPRRPRAPAQEAGGRVARRGDVDRTRRARAGDRATSARRRA
jgi:hypothetical protein